MRLAGGPLGVRSFRLLAGGQFTSTIGDYRYAEFREFGAMAEGEADGAGAPAAKREEPVVG
jgi:hypothetical protein